MIMSVLVYSVGTLSKTACCVRNKLPHAQLKRSFAARIIGTSNDHRKNFIGVCKNAYKFTACFRCNFNNL
jgi:hypothetical protein